MSLYVIVGTEGPKSVLGMQRVCDGVEAFTDLRSGEMICAPAPLFFSPVMTFLPLKTATSSL